MKHEEITYKIIACAMEVHKPGFTGLKGFVRKIG